jgi:glycosyltransferase involved in cell wall biosynthesis
VENIIEIFKAFPEYHLGCILAFFAILLFYYLFFFFRVGVYKESISNTFRPPVSVIICARNEEDNLMAFIPKIFAQDYPDFEVVVVNDRSWDKSLDILTAYKERYGEKLKIVNLDEEHIHDRGKKLALTIGIKAAKNEHLLLTDADCYPNSPEWIKTMVSGFADSKELVIGFSPFEKRPGLLNLLIRTDGLGVALNYLSFALAGIPYMGVGRNMAYTKSLYFNSGGFRRHYHVRSGDDDLFVNYLAKTNIAVSANEQGFMLTLPSQTFSQWLRQKQRHYTTAIHYKLIHKILLILYPLAMYGFLISILLLFIYENGFYIAFGLFILKSIIQILTFILPMKKLKQTDLIFLYPFLEYINLFFQTFNYIRQSQYKPAQWN